VLNKCTTLAAPAATIPAIPGSTRETIEKLQRDLIAIRAAQKAERMTTGVGSLKAYKQRMREEKKICRQLWKERARAIREFAASRGWRVAKHPIGLSYIHPTFDLPRWCESCGGFCLKNKYDTCRDAPETWGDGFHDKSQRQNVALKHTRHSLKVCEVYAALAGLKVTQLEYSWYGPEFTAVLFERRVSR
jgi:hypothetical protein